jgi:hypothetical protein
MLDPMKDCFKNVSELFPLQKAAPKCASHLKRLGCHFPCVCRWEMTLGNESALLVLARALPISGTGFLKRIKNEWLGWKKRFLGRFPD